MGSFSPIQQPMAPSSPDSAIQWVGSSHTHILHVCKHTHITPPPEAATADGPSPRMDFRFLWGDRKDGQGLPPPERASSVGKLQGDTRKVQALEPDIPLFQILVLSFASNLIWAAYRTPQSLH